MSKLGSLYIKMGSPEGELSGGCCEIDGWAADEIERLQEQVRVQFKCVLSGRNRK